MSVTRHLKILWTFFSIMLPLTSDCSRLLSFSKSVHILPSSTISLTTKGPACASNLEQVLLRYNRGTCTSSGNSDDRRRDYKIAYRSSPFSSGCVPHPH